MLTSARKQVVGLARDVRTMEQSSTGRLGSSFEASKNKIRQLGGELKGAKAQLASFQVKATASGGATGTLARQIAQAEKRVQTLSGSLRRASTAHKEHIAAIKTEIGSLGRLRQQYRDLSTQMDTARAKQKALSANMAARDANKSRRDDMRGGLMDVAIRSGYGFFSDGSS